MADKQELKQIEAQLEKIAKLYEELNETNPLRGRTAQQFVKSIGDASKAVNLLDNQIAGLRSRIIDTASGLGDITKQLNNTLSELGVKGPTAVQNITKGLKGIRSIASSLQDIQDDLGESSEKEIIRLQKRNRLEAVRLDRQSKFVLEEAKAKRGNQSFTRALEKLEGNLNSTQAKRNKLKEAELKGDQEQINQLTASIAANDAAYERKVENLITQYNLTEQEVAALTAAKNRVFAQEQLNDALNENLRRVKNINKAQGLTGKLVKGIGGSLEKIGFGDLGLSQVQEDMKQMAIDLTNNGDKVAGFGGKFRIMLKGISEVGKNLAKNLTDPVVVIGLLVKGFKSLLEFGQKVSKDIATIGQQFMGLGSQAKELDQSFRNLAESDPFLSVEEAREAFINLNKEFGTAVEFSERETKTFKQMSYDLGLGAEQTSKLYKLSQLSGSSFESITAEINSTVNELNLANGLSLNQSEILADVAKLSATVRTNLGNNPKALATAVYQARRLGMSLDEINSAAGTTLEFESSIEKQLSAQLLLGTQLDASAYRRAALSGDSETAAKELNKLIAENADKLEGNVIKQQEFAGFLGISQEQLLAGIETSKLQEKLALKGITDRANAQKALQKIMKDDPRLSQEEALAKLSQKKIDDIIKQNEQAELTKRAFEDVKETFVTQFAPVAEELAKNLRTFIEGEGFEGIKSTVKSIAKTAASIVKLTMPVIKFVAENPIKALGIALTAAIGTLLAGLAAQKLIPQITIPLGGYKAYFGKMGRVFTKGFGKLGKIFTKGFGKMGALIAAKTSAKAVATASSKAAAKAASKAASKTATQAIMKDSGKILYGAAAKSAIKAGSATAVGKGGVSVTKAVMKSTGKTVYGAAAKSAVKAGTAKAVAGTATKTIAKQAGKTAAKGIGKSLLKKIPLIGLLAGIGFAISRANKGDYLGAVGELASGAVSIIPGFGTAASVAIDAGLAARDIKKAVDGDENAGRGSEAPPSLESSSSTLPTLGDFISRPGEPVRRFDKGDIVIGGTNLLDNNSGQSVDNSEVINLLQRLIGAVEKGGDVYLDGNKVGTALGMASYRTQ